MTKTGLVGKAIFAVERERVISGSTPISSKIRERFDIRGDNLTVKYTGPAHLIDKPTSQHFIGAKSLGTRGSLKGKARRVGAVAAFGGSNRGAFGSHRRTKNGKRALTIGGNVRAYAFHPGTKGKRFFQKAKKKSYDKLPAVYARAGVTEPLRRAFK